VVPVPVDAGSHRCGGGGQITLSSGLFLLVLALLRGNEQGWTSTPIVAELIGAAVALAAFVAIERRVAEPMLPLRFFRDPSFTGAQIVALGSVPPERSGVAAGVNDTYRQAGIAVGVARSSGAAVAGQ